MKKALELAERGGANVSPNPKVGACVVKNGRLVGSGYHAFFGGPHAETVALKKAGSRAQGAVLYVTLEPCSTWGKTPPCVQTVLKSGVSRVVIGMLDPNRKHYGKGVQALKRAKISVTSGVLEREVRCQNESFVKWIKTGLPFVSLKMAQSLDGKIAAAGGRSRWISGRAARNFVHRLRAEQDAIMVGKRTAFMDDPRLSPLNHKPRLDVLKPWRVVLDPKGEISPQSRIFHGKQLTLKVVSEGYARERSDDRKFSGNILVSAPLGQKIDLRSLLKQLGALGIARLLVEGGGETAWSLLSEKLVDRFFWIVAPKFIGGRDSVTSLEGTGVLNPNRAISPKTIVCRQLGKDWIFEGTF